MSDVVDLNGEPLHLEDNIEFVADMARYQESILDRRYLKSKWRFPKAVWESLANNSKLLDAIELETVRRVRDGSAKKEKAQLHVVKAADVLGSIVLDAKASPKHRIDASKTLDQFAGHHAEGAPMADRFVIQINLGGDIQRFDKSIAIGPDDDPPNTNVVVAIPAKKLRKKKIEDDDESV
jgi:hypothetical protein